MQCGLLGYVKKPRTSHTNTHYTEHEGKTETWSDISAEVDVYTLTVFQEVGETRQVLRVTETPHTDTQGCC